MKKLSERQQETLLILNGTGGEALSTWALASALRERQGSYRLGRPDLAMYNTVEGLTKRGLVEEVYEIGSGSRWRITDAGQAEVRRMQDGAL